MYVKSLQSKTVKPVIYSFDSLDVYYEVGFIKEASVGNKLRTNFLTHPYTKPFTNEVQSLRGILL